MPDLAKRTTDSEERQEVGRVSDVGSSENGKQKTEKLKIGTEFMDTW